MLEYTVKRMVQLVPVFFGVTLLLFLAANHLPGADPIAMRFGDRTPPPEVRQAIVEQYGLDKPWHVQYRRYLAGLMPVELVDGSLGYTGVDLGTSIHSGRPVARILAETFPYTIRLALVALAFEFIVGVGAGILAAVRRDTFWDAFVRLSTSVLVSLPVFWFGMMLQWIFGFWLRDVTGGLVHLPVSGASGSFPDWAYLILPGVTLASVSTAYAARITRAQMLEVTGQDYMLAARARGLSDRRLLWGHSFKNAMIPVVTFLGLDFGAMLGGALLTESVFNWPGVGFTITQAIFQRDFPVVFGGVTVLLFAVMLVNLVVDLSYAWLDPRVRYGGASG